MINIWCDGLDTWIQAAILVLLTGIALGPQRKETPISVLRVAFTWIIPHRKTFMTQEEIQSLYLRFASPLAALAWSAPTKAVNLLARNLWVALIAGPQLEKYLWETMAETAGLEKDLLTAVQDCYYQKM